MNILPSLIKLLNSPSIPAAAELLAKVKMFDDTADAILDYHELDTLTDTPSPEMVERVLHSQMALLAIHALHQYPSLPTVILEDIRSLLQRAGYKFAKSFTQRSEGLPSEVAIFADATFVTRVDVSEAKTFLLELEQGNHSEWLPELSSTGFKG